MYLNDCIVYASSEDQFVERLREVLQRFKDRGLLLKAKKCRFGMASIEYVGRVVSKDGFSMSTPIIENVLNFPRPKTMTALRSLLGLANYFRGFVPNHSDIVRPLQNMIGHKARNLEAPTWTPAGVEAFHAIKLAISRCPLMTTTRPIRYRPTNAATHQVARPPGGHFPHGLGVHFKAPGLKEDEENPRQQVRAVNLRPQQRHSPQRLHGVRHRDGTRTSW